MGEFSIVQYILIGVGILIALPSVVEFFKGFSLPVLKSKSKDKYEHGLTDIVCKWECLYEACELASLTEACDKLDEAFPLLVKRDEDLEEQEEEIEILND